MRPRESWWLELLPGACSALLVVAHAPHSGVDAAARSLWWDDLSRRLAGQPDVVLLVDANARLGSSVSASVGSGGMCQQEDLSGAMFHRTLVELGLCVPATFGPVDLRPSLGLRMVGRLTALIMLLCHAPGTVAPGSVVATWLPLGRLATC